MFPSTTIAGANCGHLVPVNDTGTATNLGLFAETARKSGIRENRRLAPGSKSKDGSVFRSKKSNPGTLPIPKLGSTKMRVPETQSYASDLGDCKRNNAPFLLLWCRLCWTAIVFFWPWLYLGWRGRPLPGPPTGDRGVDAVHVGYIEQRKDPPNFKSVVASLVLQPLSVVSVWLRGVWFCSNCDTKSSPRGFPLWPCLDHFLCRHTRVRLGSSALGSSPSGSGWGDVFDQSQAFQRIWRLKGSGP